MSKSIVTEVKEAVVNVDNQKSGLINAASVVGGIIAGGFIQKGTSKVAMLEKYNWLVNLLILSLSTGVQFLPVRLLPSWAKYMAVGVGGYSILSLLGNIASHDKTPQPVKDFLTGYLPTISNGTSLTGMGSIADAWASETYPAISETVQTAAVVQSPAGGSDKTMNGAGSMGGSTWIMN